MNYPFFLVLYLLIGLAISTFILMKQPAYYRSFFYFILCMFIWPISLTLSVVQYIEFLVRSR